MKAISVCGAVGFLAACLAVLSCSAENSVTLDGELYLGVRLGGSPGTVYAIEATADLAHTNDWRCLDFVQVPRSGSLWIDPAAPTTRRFYRATLMELTNLVFIPPGSFRMGSPTNELDRSADEGPQTVVTLTKGFYMGKYPVTQQEYEAVVKANPSLYTHDKTRPVESITWDEATNYCAKRTDQETAAGLIPAGSQYRLPTEAEWEYACRALNSTPLNYGNDPGYTNLANYAWFRANSGSGTQAVGQKLPNAWGLYDIVGNVWTWCQDWYGRYPGGTELDPPGPERTSFLKVVRGGSWGNSATFCRSAQRGSFVPTSRFPIIGLRVVLAVPP